MSHLNYIINPLTNRSVSIHTRKGRQILNNYISQLGGHDGPCAINPSSGRCAKSKKPDGNCQLSNGRCVKASAKKSVRTSRPSRPKTSPKKNVRPSRPKASPKKSVRPSRPKASPKKYVRPSRPKKNVRPSRPKTSPKMVKKVTTKSKGTTMRLSAGEYFRKYGPISVGDRCDIRQNNEYRCLLQRKNGTPYWAKKSKSGKGQEICGNWKSKCREYDFN